MELVHVNSVYSQKEGIFVDVVLQSRGEEYRSKFGWWEMERYEWQNEARRQMGEECLTLAEKLFLTGSFIDRYLYVAIEM